MGLLDWLIGSKTTSGSGKSRKAAMGREFTNSLGMRFVLIPSGTFVMGSPPDEDLERNDNEVQHTVFISKPFYVAVSPVTNGQYRHFRPNHDSGSYIGVETMRRNSLNGDDQPAVEVRWDDARAYAEWLTQKEGKGYRLPSEAEWEYACRAGYKGAYSLENCKTGNPPNGFGPDGTRIKDKLKQIAWFMDNSGEQTHAVKQKQPNAWGLYDMHGNVAEWCLDVWGDYTTKSVTDPINQEGDTSWHVVRGGYWNRVYHEIRAASRSRASRANNAIGFRLVCTG